jgi:hypothetical protein
MEYYDDFNESPEDYFEPETPDSYFLEVQEEIKNIFEEDRKAVFILDNYKLDLKINISIGLQIMQLMAY